MTKICERNIPYFFDATVFKLYKQLYLLYLVYVHHSLNNAYNLNRKGF